MSAPRPGLGRAITDRPRLGWRNSLVAFLVAAGASMAWWGNWRAAGVACALVALAWWAASAGRQGYGRIRYAASPRGIAWVHPHRDSGMLLWRDVGAVALRPGRRPADAALMIVGRGEGPSLVVTGGDLGFRGDAAVRALREFAGEVLPQLPADVTLDRDLRKWLGEPGPGAARRP